jgi:DNA-directed RNA polymerase specialized sigma24 family protein
LERVNLEQAEALAASNDEQLLAVNEALDKLVAEDKLEGELVKLRYFVGMTLDEAAEVLGISARTADNYWAHARAWLFSELSDRRSTPLS